MADLIPTAANVSVGSNSVVVQGVAGATITAGEALYKEASSGKYKLADNNNATAEVKSFDGIALNSASDGQPLSVLTAGDIDVGDTLVPGTTYFVSDTAGGIIPAGDLMSGMDVILIGIATAADNLNVRAKDTGVTLSA